MESLVIIDDEKIVIDGIRAMMSIIDPDIVIEGSAMDGISAFDLLRSTSPDYVITDIRMPGMDGLSLIEAAQVFLPRTVFIVVSGYQEFEYARKALSLGVVEYLDKPLTLEKLQNVFRKAKQVRNRIDKSFTDSYNHDELVEKLFWSIRNEAKEELGKTVHNTLKIIKQQENFNEYKKEIYMILCILTMIAFEESAAFKAAFKTLPSYHAIENLKDYNDVDHYVEERLTDMADLFCLLKPEDNLTVTKLLKYIDENYDRDISLAELAEVVNMNMTYLSVFFKEKVGISYIKYIRNLRMEKAKLLLNEGYRVVDVCFMVGYSDPRHFSELFQKETGVTPSKFKKGNGQ